MLHHTRAVVRGTKRALVIGDMPFLTYSTPDEATDNAGKFMQDGGAQAVKVEGGVRSRAHRRGAREVGRPGHGPHRLDARSRSTARRQGQGPGQDAGRGPGLLADAIAIQEAGAFSIVLELVPEQLRRSSPRAHRSRRSASAPVRIAPARSRSSPTCSASATSTRSTRGPTRTSRARWRRDAPLDGRRRRRDIPRPAETVRMDDAVLDEALGRHADDRASAAPPRSSRSTATSSPTPLTSGERR